MLVSEVIEETRRLLFTGQREERNKLNGALTNSATTLTVTYPLGSITRGSKLSIDLEDMYVWGSTSLTVSPIDRGQFGSTAATHADASTIYVNSKFTPWEIFNAVNDEINDLSSPLNGLYYIGTVEIEYNPSIQGYSYTATNLLDIYDVQYEVTGPSLAWYQSSDYELSRNMGANFAAGSALFVRDAYPYRSVLVKGKFAFTELAATMATNLTTSNVPTTAYDILSLGAAMRLTAPREIRRNFDEIQGDTRRSDEVPPGANLGGSRELARLRNERIKAERARLSLINPTRSHRYPYSITR